jgi:quercetin dioxygenase-like cupin family protein
MWNRFAIFTLIFGAATASAAPTLSGMRLNADEVKARASQSSGNQIGSSKLAGVHTTFLYGDPSKAGFYTILLYVPAHTSIPAHSHRDDRMGAVLSGSWNFGYGKAFEENELKNLPPGSVYSEPGGVNHFARTDNLPSIVQSSGFGPTNTTYVDRADDPAGKR